MPRSVTALVLIFTMCAIGFACSSDAAGPAATLPVASVSVSPDSVALARGTTEQLLATAKDANGNALPGRQITWMTSDSSVAEVSPTGQISARAGGVATVTASSDGHTGSAIVTVIVAVTGLTVADSILILPVGATTTLSARLLPADATDTTVAWTSSDSSVAAVSKSGLVTGLKPGAALISVTTHDGGFSANRVVHVGFTLRVSLRNPAGATSAAQVLAFDQTAKTYTEPGWVDTTGYWFHSAISKQVIVLVADPKFAGAASAPIEDTSSVSIAVNDTSRGSVIAENTVCFIPGLAGRLNPLEDELGRTYLYADNISINNGAQQPVDFDSVNPLDLVDANDVRTRIWIPFIDGSTALVNYTLPALRNP